MGVMSLKVVIQELIGEVVNAKVLRDGSLLVFCKDMAQRKNALRVTQIGKCKVVWSSWTDQAGKQWIKGVITGVPVSVSTIEVQFERRRSSVFKDCKQQGVELG